MTINQQSKVPMHAVKVSFDPLASQGARRATEDASGSAPSPIPPGGDSEVVPRARRRTFTNADKRRILQAADLCTKPGEVGALMRREGLDIFSRFVVGWLIAPRECAELAQQLKDAERPRPAVSTRSTSRRRSGSGCRAQAPAIRS